MDRYITTPHNFIWREKEPEKYWADSIDEVKYLVYINDRKLGGFVGVNRTFDDDMYYVNFYDENNRYSYTSAYRDTEIVLERIGDRQ